MNAHSRSVAKTCIKTAEKKHGTGWQYLSEVQQRGAVALEVVHVLLAQAARPVNVDPSSHVETLEHCQDVARAALYPELQPD